MLIGTPRYEHALEDISATKIGRDAGRMKARNKKKSYRFLPGQAVLGTVSRSPDLGLAFWR
jgi:hypothetical protein